jgi:hypothetical protein
MVLTLLQAGEKSKRRAKEKVDGQPAHPPLGNELI